jgi:hypothetical protein
MDTSDVDPTAPSGEKRCIAHLFKPCKLNFLGGMGAPPFGIPLRTSDTPAWLPTILFDTVYASTVLHHFGTQTLKDVVTATWMDTFYRRRHGSGTSTSPRRGEAQKHAHARQTRYEACTLPDTFDMLLALPYILVPRNELQATLREAKEKAAAEQRRVTRKLTLGTGKSSIHSWHAILLAW